MGITPHGYCQFVPMYPPESTTHEPAEHEQAAQDADDTGCWEREPGSGQCGLHLMPLIHRGRCIEGTRAAARAEGARAERERLLVVVRDCINMHGLRYVADLVCDAMRRAAQDKHGGKGD